MTLFVKQNCESCFLSFPVHSFPVLTKRHILKVYSCNQHFMEPDNIQDAALQFLLKPENLTAVIGTCENHQPHSATVYYVVDESLNFYFLTATNTTKYNQLIANNTASIVVGFGPAYVTMQGHGETELLTKGSDTEKHALALIKNRLLAAKHTWPLFQLSAFDSESIAVFKLTPTTLSLLNLESDNGLKVDTETIQKII